MKKFMVICAPVTSRSGYGDHARDLVWSFMDNENYDIKIIDVRWGDTPRNALKENDKRHKNIIDIIIKNPEQEITKKPDIYVDIRIPNEFQQIGQFNIGITAGIETTGVSQAWLEGCNKMDLTIVPSEHSKSSFVQTIYDKMHPGPDGQQQKVGEFKLEKPMEVLFEGIDENIFKNIQLDSNDSFLSELNNDFCFLFVGLWGNQPFGEDRKDVGKLVKIFYESFANKKEQPALILKTNGASFSILDREDIIGRLKDIKSKFPSDWKLPDVYLLHGSLSDKEMNKLYNHPKIKCMISLTHGEGFGRPLLEATMTGLPVITTGWSGQLDFLDADNSVLLGGELKQVPQSAVWENIVIPESRWFNVDENEVYKIFNYFYKNVKTFKSKSEKLMSINRQKFTLKNMSKKLNKIIEKYTKDMPVNVGINLPKLKKSSNTPKINLPKLKK